jgi:hypothetical protein
MSQARDRLLGLMINSAAPAGGTWAIQLTWETDGYQLIVSSRREALTPEEGTRDDALAALVAREGG